MNNYEPPGSGCAGGCLGLIVLIVLAWITMAIVPSCGVLSLVFGG